jgi:ubiquinone/menaquinone biosynthesis C-methylase UbiE
MRKFIQSITPVSFTESMRKGCYFFTGIYEALFGVRESLAPPRCMSAEGRKSYKIIGDEFLQYFIEIGGLKKTDRILDVGSGIGRMAVPIAEYLLNEGSYEGIDIINYGVSWCTKKITPRYPNFHFQLADVYNKNYYPKGKQKASDYRFPFEENSFDFVLLTSVFTHMLPAEIENYLSEITRVLKPGGKCFITYFLLNQESLNHIENNKSRFAFKYDFEEYRIENKDVPEIAISFDESYIHQLYEKNGLNIAEPIHYVSWCGRDQHLSFQDIIVASKN